MTIYGYIWKYFGWLIGIGLIVGDLTTRGSEQSSSGTQMFGWVLLALWVGLLLKRLARQP